MPAATTGGQRTVNIVTDQAYWYPFTYSLEGQAKGIHIDMVQKALSNLNYAVRFYPRPWKRCLKEIEEGQYDAIVSASYQPERAKYLIYPDDAANTLKSRWRITQVEYVVITNSDTPYAFDGDIQTLPPPVRAPLGYSIADDLKAAGISVLEAPDPVDCVQQLVKSGRGSFVTPPENAAELQIDKRFAGKLKAHVPPVKSKSYFMAFSIKSRNFDQEEILSIWNEIARLREDREFMKGLFNSYKGLK